MLASGPQHIYVAGADTLIGGAIVRRLRALGNCELVGVDHHAPDYTSAAALDAFFTKYHPQQVYVAAGESGGILANQRYPARLMLDNLLAATNLISASHQHRVGKLLYLGSSCCYPRNCPQPMRVESLLTAPLEPTNEPYALAKLAGIKLCQSYRRQHGPERCRFIVGIPANAFGPGDHFDPQDSHVIPPLIHRFHHAMVHREPEVAVWGTGKAQREFIFADDLADACLTVMRDYDDDAPINLGSGGSGGGGGGVTIRELVEVIRAAVGYTGASRFDASKPDGMPAKSLDGSALAALGWRPTTDLPTAIRATYRWYCEHSAGKELSRV